MASNELRNKFKNKSTGELLKALSILILKYVIVFILRIVLQLIKGAVWCWKFCGHCINETREFWNSNDTQEKKRKFRIIVRASAKKFVRWCKIAWAFSKKYTCIGGALFWKYTCIGTRALIKYSFVFLLGIVHGTIWLVCTIKDLIIHSKPTFIRLGKSIKKGCIEFGHWTIRTYRGCKLRRIRRKRAWQHFRRTKGFKGLLADIGNGLSNGIESYMSEEETESSPEAVTEDDIFAEEMEGQRDGRKSIVNRFFESIKNIVEDN